MHIRTNVILALAAAMFLTAGCAGPERKLGRGISNATEFARLGEMGRSMEQTLLFDNSGSYALGMVRGISRSVERTAVGVYEIVSFPIPDRRGYDPLLKPEHPQYADCYKPGRMGDVFLNPDANLGFSGGDILPFVPGNRFRIFEN